MSFETLFQQDTVHGTLLAVSLPVVSVAGAAALFSDPESIRQLSGELLEEEQAFALGLGPARRTGWIGGRIALRRALASLGVQAGPLLANHRGAPKLPPGHVGSVSHKRAIAVALCGRSEEGGTIGVDVEQDTASRVDISRKILTDLELRALESIAPEERPRQVMLAFSLKEALYKAIDPRVQRYVGFREVEVDIALDGTASFGLGAVDREGPFVAGGTWQRREGIILTTARVRCLADGSG